MSNVEKEFDFFGRKEQDKVPLADEVIQIAKETRNDYVSTPLLIIPIVLLFFLLSTLFNFLSDNGSYSKRQIEHNKANNVSKSIDKMYYDPPMSAKEKAQLEKAIDELRLQSAMDTFPKDLAPKNIKVQNTSKAEEKKMEEFRAKLMSNELSPEEAIKAINTLDNIQKKNFNKVELIPN